MDVKAKSVTGFYDDEAARIASAAARAPQTAKPNEKAVDPAPYVPPVLLDDPQRPLLTPETPTNQNTRTSTDAAPTKAPVRRNRGVLRVLAWIVVLPWYIAIAAASVALVFLFLKDLFGF